MKSYVKEFGYAILMLILGLCPMGLGVIFAVISGEKYASFIMDLSLFAGAMLCICVMKKQFNIEAKVAFKKPQPDSLFLVAVMSLAYTVITALTEYRAILSAPSDEVYSVADWIGTGFLALVAEEIIFRFSMLSLLLMSGGRGKKIVSFMIISAIWAVIHFNGDIIRFIDIFNVEIILNIIFIKSKNILYCIIFHSIANIAIYIVSINSIFFVNKIWLLYISIPAFIIFICIFLTKSLNRRTN